MSRLIMIGKIRNLTFYINIPQNLIIFKKHFEIFIQFRNRYNSFLHLLSRLFFAKRKDLVKRNVHLFFTKRKEWSQKKRSVLPLTSSCSNFLFFFTLTFQICTFGNERRKEKKINLLRNKVCVVLRSAILPAMRLSGEK